MAKRRRGPKRDARGRFVSKELTESAFAKRVRREARKERAPLPFDAPGLTPQQRARRKTESLVRRIMEEDKVSRSAALKAARGAHYAVYKEAVDHARGRYVEIRTGRNKGKFYRHGDKSRKPIGKTVKESRRKVQAAMRQAAYWVAVKKIARNRGWTVDRARRHYKRVLEGRLARGDRGQSWEILRDVLES